MAPQPPTRVITVDTQALVHAGVRQFLAPFDDLLLVGEAYNAADAAYLCETERPDALLVEIDALGPEWVATLRRLHARHSRLRIIILASAVDGALVVDALDAGACGYLLKDLNSLTLVQAIRSALRGQQVLAPEARNALAATRGDAERLSFSPREREVLTLMARGLANKAIAEELCVSTSTVKFHVASLLTKLGVNSRAQAIVRAYEYSLVRRYAPSPDEAYVLRLDARRPRLARHA
jgi:DNA-binding NarL/FixJ family response regulator